MKFNHIREWLKAKLKAQDKQQPASFTGLIAYSLDSYSTLWLSLFFLYFFFALFPVYNSPSTGDISRNTQVFGGLATLALIVYALFYEFYVNRNLLPKINQLSIQEKYGILKAHASYPKTALFSIILSISLIFAWNIGHNTNLISEQAYQSVNLIFSFFADFLLFFGIFNIYQMMALKIKTETELSFYVIQESKNIADYHNSWFNLPIFSSSIWSLCMKNIIHRVEVSLKKQLGVNGDLEPEFYEPFNIVSFAVFAGSHEQQEEGEKMGC